MKDKQYKYQLRVTEKQLSIMMEALEMYSRHMAGQFDYSLFPPTFESYLWKKKLNKRDLLDDLVKFKQRTFPELQTTDTKYTHASLGIGHPQLPEEARIAYSMYDFMRVGRQDKFVWAVNNKSADNFSTQQPPIEIKHIKDMNAETKHDA